MKSQRGEGKEKRMIHSLIDSLVRAFALVCSSCFFDLAHPSLQTDAAVDPSLPWLLLRVLSSGFLASEAAFEFSAKKETWNRSIDRSIDRTNESETNLKRKNEKSELIDQSLSFLYFRCLFIDRRLLLLVRAI